MKKIDLVFRTVGERTSQIALDLAIKNIQPRQVHIIENVKPFAHAVQQMLKMNYDCDFVVFMDADCLIMEDMSPFLTRNSLPYVDCYVLDKFRGHIHCGVHITRIDVIREMQAIKVPDNDAKYVLRPESRTRALALKKLKLKKAFKKFNIIHDFFQFYHHIFAKCALRELRSRQDYHQAKLTICQEDWGRQEKDLDFLVAKYGVDSARKYISKQASQPEIARFIENLPNIALRELKQMNILEKAPLTLAETIEFSSKIIIQRPMISKKMKVFGIGLSRTGTKSLTMALNMLGINVVHYPDDETILQDLMAAKYDFSILNDYDGITDITVAPFYSQLDKLFPDSKFILTVRNKSCWLKSLEAHWSKRSAFDFDPSNETKMQIRRLLRAAVYGTYAFNEDRMSYVYDLHYRNVLEYFKDRPESLLIIDVCDGEGWEKLCPFFNLPILEEPFPWMKKKTVLTEILSGVK